MMTGERALASVRCAACDSAHLETVRAHECADARTPFDLVNAGARRAPGEIVGLGARFHLGVHPRTLPCKGSARGRQVGGSEPSSLPADTCVTRTLSDAIFAAARA